MSDYRLVRADDPQDFYSKVNQAFADEYFLLSPLVVVGCQITQFLQKGADGMSYLLLVADSVDDLALRVEKARLEGYGLMFWHVCFDGKILQWVARYQGLSIGIERHEPAVVVSGVLLGSSLS